MTTPDAVRALADEVIDRLVVEAQADLEYPGLAIDVAAQALATALPGWLAERAAAGDLSDGHHTFAEIYEHRHMLFRALLASRGGWMSKLHEDGTGFDGWFIAGGETPSGPVTYHIPMRLWNAFAEVADVRPLGKQWDGHTAADVVTRLGSIPAGLDAGALDAAAEDAASQLAHMLNEDWSERDAAEVLTYALAPHWPTEPTLADLRERLEGMSDREVQDLVFAAEYVAGGAEVTPNLTEPLPGDPPHESDGAQYRNLFRAVLDELGRAHTEGDHGRD